MTTGKSPLKYYISHVDQNRMSTNINIYVQVLINNRVVHARVGSCSGTCNVRDGVAMGTQFGKESGEWVLRVEG